jgi:GT2 family glycosyltransferase
LPPICAARASLKHAGVSSGWCGEKKSAMAPDLSIVIPSHSRPDLLRRCLESLAKYAPPNAEILVVDDGSPEQVVSRVADQFGVGKLRLPGPGPELWPAPGSSIPRSATRRWAGGFCVAANRGVRAARGAIVELLNDDTEVTAGWAEAALAGFADPAVAAVAPLVLYRQQQPLAEEIVDSAGDRYYVGGVAAKRGHRRRLAELALERGPVFGASASSAFFRRDVLLQVGGFPETFEAYFEDVDVAFRIHRAGYAVLFEPTSRVRHHVSASYGRPRRRLLEQQSWNEERVFWRNLPTKDLLRALPRHGAVLAAKGLRRWREGALVPFLCGRLRLLLEMPEVMRHRRWLRNLGTASSIEAWGVEGSYWG